MLEIQEILYRLVVASFFGFMIGYERELHGRSAGIKTQMIVAASSCLLMIISLQLEGLHETMGAQTVVRLDPGRIASYAVAGMGFLGAGAIIQGRGSVQGLTTAACLWGGNAVGLAVGGGFIPSAGIATILILLILLFVSPLGDRLNKDTYLRVYLDFETCEDMTGSIREFLAGYKVKLLYTGFDCRFETGESKYEVAIRVKTHTDYSELIGTLRKLEGLTGIRWAEGYVP